MEELKQLGTQREDEVEIDLGEIFHLMLSKLWLLILCFIVGATLAFGGTKFLVTPKYSASSMIYILTKTTSVTSLADIQMGSQLTADFEILATSRPVVEEVIEKLDLNNLSYSYAGGKEIRYSDISISRGECIGIVGHSGAGKSTLISVLTSLYENYNGMIYINGTQLRAIDKSWYRSRIAYVDQGTSLFDRSIMENVRYAMKDGMVDIGDIAEHINIGEDILERMTSNGLSGGEKQRIVLLREILKQADVIILDEFSSALDDVKQIEAMKLVKQLYKDKIIIMITHDSELLVNCDRVYEMKLC